MIRGALARAALLLALLPPPAAAEAARVRLATQGESPSLVFAAEHPFTLAFERQGQLGILRFDGVTAPDLSPWLARLSSYLAGGAPGRDGRSWRLLLRRGVEVRTSCSQERQCQVAFRRGATSDIGLRIGRRQRGYRLVFEGPAAARAEVVREGRGLRLDFPAPLAATVAARLQRLTALAQRELADASVRLAPQVGWALTLLRLPPDRLVVDLLPEAQGVTSAAVREPPPQGAALLSRPMGPRGDQEATASKDTKPTEHVADGADAGGKSAAEAPREQRREAAPPAQAPAQEGRRLEEAVSSGSAAPAPESGAEALGQATESRARERPRTPARMDDGPADLWLTAEAGRGLRLRWSSPTGLAALKRGRRLLLLFDRASGRVEADRAALAQLLRGRARDLRIDRLEQATLVQLTLTRPEPVAVAGGGSEWRLLFDTSPPAPAPPPIRALENGLVVKVGQAHRRFTDPVAGDRLEALTCGEAGQALPSPRRMVDLEWLPTLVCVVWRPLRDDLRVEPVPGGWRITRPGGLRLAATGPMDPVTAPADPRGTEDREVRDETPQAPTTTPAKPIASSKAEPRRPDARPPTTTNVATRAKIPPSDEGRKVAASAGASETEHPALPAREERGALTDPANHGAASSDPAREGAGSGHAPSPDKGQMTAAVSAPSAGQYDTGDDGTTTKTSGDGASAGPGGEPATRHTLAESEPAESGHSRARPLPPADPDPDLPPWRTPTGLSELAGLDGRERHRLMQAFRRTMVQRPPAARTAARLELARLMLAEALGPEAGTQLALLPPEARRQDRARLLALAAATLAGDLDRAEALLRDPRLPDAAEVDLFRVVVATASRQWDTAAKALARAHRTLRAYPVPLQRRLGPAMIAAALQAGDPNRAFVWLDRLGQLPLSRREREALRFLEALTVARDGGEKEALMILRTLEREAGWRVALQAGFARIRLALDLGRMAPQAALQELRRLQQLARGHPWEPAMLRELGRLEAEAGEVEAALAAWREALTRYPKAPETRGLAKEMRELARRVIDPAVPPDPPPAEALAFLKRRAELFRFDPPTLDALYRLAVALGEERPASALALLEAHQSRLEDPQRRARWDLLRAQLLASLDRPGEALALLTPLLRPDSPVRAEARRLATQLQVRAGDVRALTASEAESEGDVPLPLLLEQALRAEDRALVSRLVDRWLAGNPGPPADVGEAALLYRAALMLQAAGERERVALLRERLRGLEGDSGWRRRLVLLEESPPLPPTVDAALARLQQERAQQRELEDELRRSLEPAVPGVPAGELGDGTPPGV